MLVTLMAGKGTNIIFSHNQMYLTNLVLQILKLSQKIIWWTTSSKPSDMNLLFLHLGLFSTLGSIFRILLIVENVHSQLLSEV